MSKQINELRSQDKRMFLIALGKSLGWSVIFGRLYYFQIFQSYKYRTLSDGNRIRVFIDPAERGKILDKNNNTLAEDIYYETMAITPKMIKDYANKIKILASILELSDERVKELLKQKGRRVIVLGDAVNWHKVTEITHHIPDLHGIAIVSLRRRFYPFGSISAHIVGYTKAIENLHLPILNNNRIDIGTTGIEKTRNDLLTGRTGFVKIEINASGNFVREVERNNGYRGSDTVISLDAELQNYAGELLRGVAGTMIVIDNLNGSIPVLYSSPSYDPNAIITGMTHDEWNRLSQHEQSPMFNRTTMHLMPPASTYKLIVAISALSKQIISSHSTFKCSGSMYVGNRDFRCMGKHGTITIKSAIAKSCNVFFYNLAKTIDIDYTATIAKKLGLGVDPGLEIMSETNTIIPTAHWKQKKYKTKWQLGDSLNYVIGQGYTLCTPMQLAVMISRIATRKKLHPTLTLPAPRVNFDDLDINNQILDIVAEGMIQTMNTPHGTGYQAATYHDIGVIAGKTGTAQMISPKYGQRTNSLFVGYAPYYKPRYSICTTIENVSSAETKAVSLASAMLKHILLLTV